MPCHHGCSSRLVEPWTGELRSADSLGVESVQRVADDATFDRIVDGWRRSREMYQDADVESVMGQSSSLADNVSLLADTIPSVEPSPLADSVAVVSTESSMTEQLLQGVSLATGSEGMFWVDVLLNLFVFGVLIGYLLRNVQQRYQPCRLIHHHLNIHNLQKHF